MKKIKLKGVLTPKEVVKLYKANNLTNEIKKLVCDGYNQLCQNIIGYCGALDYPNTVAPNYNDCVSWEFDFYTKNGENNYLIEKIHPKENSITSENFEEKLYNFVMKGEGSFQANAFCDSYYKTTSGMIRKTPDDCTYWSIGYGTKSYRGEVITYDEAIKRKKEDLANRSKLITSNCLTDNQKVVVVDFLYQHGVNSSEMKYKANNCLKSSIFFTIAGWRDEYKKTKKWGMVKREQMRLNYFYNN